MDLFTAVAGHEETSCATARLFPRGSRAENRDTSTSPAKKLYRPMFAASTEWLSQAALVATGQRPALRALHRGDVDRAAGLEIPLSHERHFPSSRLLLALVLAPLLLGVINRTKAFFAGRTGQPLLQSYFDLWKLLRKGAVYSRTTTWVFRAGPIVGLAAVLVALALVPLGGAAALHRLSRRSDRCSPTCSG